MGFFSFLSNMGKKILPGAVNMAKKASDIAQHIGKGASVASDIANKVNAMATQVGATNQGNLIGRIASKVADASGKVANTADKVGAISSMVNDKLQSGINRFSQPNLIE